MLKISPNTTSPKLTSFIDSSSDQGFLETCIIPIESHNIIKYFDSGYNLYAVYLSYDPVLLTYPAPHWKIISLIIIDWPFDISSISFIVPFSIFLPSCAFQYFSEFLLITVGSTQPFSLFAILSLIIFLITLYIDSRDGFAFITTSLKNPGLFLNAKTNLPQAIPISIWFLKTLFSFVGSIVAFNISACEIPSLLYWAASTILITLISSGGKISLVEIVVDQVSALDSLCLNWFEEPFITCCFWWWSVWIFINGFPWAKSTKTAIVSLSVGLVIANSISPYWIIWKSTTLIP